MTRCDSWTNGRA